MNKYLNTGDPASCCGCTACASICPKSCIKMVPNFEGFSYPVMDNSDCIGCKLCRSVCPMDKESDEMSCLPRVYAAMDYLERTSSSSGGVFYSIAKWIISNKKGWVFGAAFGEGFHLSHVGVNSLSDLPKLRGSKYIQSDLNGCFKKVKDLLSFETFVMFVGTPCQIAGLKAYLRRDYDCLLCVDLVCHGVPPQSLFDEHVKYIERKNKSSLHDYKFRKTDGWGGCEIAHFQNGKTVIQPSYNISPYLFSFMNNYTLRESCYGCKFACLPRHGDITLGDFWGAKHFFPEIDSSKGVSLVLINTSMGSDVWEEISSDLFVRESCVDDACKYNANLTCGSIRPQLRDGIFQRIKESGYSTIAESEFKIKHYLWERVKQWLLEQRVVKRIISILE